ncbi:MAG TPA: tetratricopeptide repeat protein [Chthoniobacterales bacterium]|nr:tetratricopeptide repeat protein [Chthoniobacterales bacterium]
MNEPECSLGRKTVLGRLLRYTEQQWIRCLLLLGFGVAARFPALQGQWIWDDNSLVRDNPLIRSPLLILESFRHFLSSESAHYRPIQTISYSFDYLVWNADIYGYHLSNLFWHVGSGILLYFLLLRLLEPFQKRWSERETGAGIPDESRFLSAAAFLVALLWIVHPVHSAAVDYISGRADSLAFFFACSAWLLFLRARSARSFSFRALGNITAALLAFVALCSRESACIWMLLFLFHLFAFDRFSTRGAKALVLAICLGLVAAYAGLRQLPSRNSSSPAGAIDSPTPGRALLMVRALGDYGRLMLVPSNLHVERTLLSPADIGPSEGWRQAIQREYLSLIGILTATALLYGALRKGKAQGIRALGAIWFVLAFLPISNLFELNATVAEHWLYLPSVGFLLFILGCCPELPARGRQILLGTACAAVLALSARSFVRSGDWMSPEIFYRHSLRAGSAKTRMALNLGQIYAGRGDYAKAEPLLRKVVEMSPNYPMGWNALGHLLVSEGKQKEAEEIFARAIALGQRAGHDQPRTWIAALNVASMHYSQKDVPDALMVLDKARADYPGTWALISFEAEMLRESNAPDAALPFVKEFADANWWHAGAFLALGQLYADKGDVEKAEAAFRHASRLDVHDVESLNRIALLDVRQNRLQDAYEVQQRAISRQPDHPRQYLLLSDILERMGRTDEARAALAQVHLLQAIAQSQPAAQSTLEPN